MAKRYFYNAIPEDLDATIMGLVPGAGVTKIDGIVAVVVPDALVSTYEPNQPAAALLTEDVPEGSDHGLAYRVPAHLLVSLKAASVANPTATGAIAIAAIAINAEVDSRSIIFGGE